MATTFDPREQPFSANLPQNYSGWKPSSVGSQQLSSYWKQPAVADRPEDKIDGFQLPNLPGYVDRQRVAGQQMLGNQDVKTQDWLGRFGSTLNNQEKLRAMFSRFGDDFQLPTLQRNAMNLQSQLEAIPETYANAARGFDVNANQLARIQSTKSAQLAPAAQRAQQQAQFAQEQVAQQMGMAQQEQQKELLPFQYEKDFLTDRIARETSMFTQDNERELRALESKMNAGVTLDQGQKERALKLQMQEREFQQQKQMADINFGHQKDLMSFQNNLMYSGGWS